MTAPAAEATGTLGKAWWIVQAALLLCLGIGAAASALGLPGWPFFAAALFLAAAGFWLAREELRRREDRLRQQQHRILNAAKFAALGEVAAGMAHEINTPLGAITLCASQLKELTPEQRGDAALTAEIVDDVLSSADRISRIVRGLRTFSRETGPAPDFVFCDLAAIVQESLALCETSLRNAGVRLRATELPARLELEGNPSQLSQVVVNLVNNARDAAAGTGEKWLEIGLRLDGDVAELRVTDSGAGIPPEIREKLFQPFFTTKAVGQGTGLGLNIVHGIVQAHRGQVFLDELSAHTCFVVRLPRAQAGR